MGSLIITSSTQFRILWHLDKTKFLSSVLLPFSHLLASEDYSPQHSFLQSKNKIVHYILILSYLDPFVHIYLIQIICFCVSIHLVRIDRIVHSPCFVINDLLRRCRILFDFFILLLSGCHGCLCFDISQLWDKQCDTLWGRQCRYTSLM